MGVRYYDFLIVMFNHRPGEATTNIMREIYKCKIQADRLFFVRTHFHTSWDD